MEPRASRVGLRRIGVGPSGPTAGAADGGRPGPGPCAAGATPVPGHPGLVTDPDGVPLCAHVPLSGAGAGAAAAGSEAPGGRTAPGDGGSRAAGTFSAIFTGIGGVFQRAGHSANLRNWYAEHLGIDISDSGTDIRVTPGGSTTWAIFDHETEYFGRPEQAFMVNFCVSDRDAMLAQLRSAGVEVIDALEESEYGASDGGRS